jgi:hypothetical protein
MNIHIDYQALLLSGERSHSAVGRKVDNGGTGLQAGIRLGSQFQIRAINLDGQPRAAAGSRQSATGLCCYLVGTTTGINTTSAEVIFILAGDS